MEARLITVGSFDCLVSYYRAAIYQRNIQLPYLPIQYADFASWQRQWLQGQVLDSQLAYWQAQLKDLPTTLNLPIDHPRPTIQTFNGATLSFQFRSFKKTFVENAFSYDPTLSTILDFVVKTMISAHYCLARRSN